MIDLVGLQGLPLLQAANGTGQLVTTMITFGMVFLIFYFLIIRPQNKKQKETKAMLARIKKGDKVQTIGGIRGIVHSVKDDTVVVRVDDTAKIEFAKSAISTVVVPEKQDKPEKAEKQDKETEAKE